jgi:hypothetical protein
VPAQLIIVSNHGVNTKAMIQIMFHLVRKDYRNDENCLVFTGFVKTGPVSMDDWFWSNKILKKLNS